MENNKPIKEWRTEEVAKLFLLKSAYKIAVDRYPSDMFDLLATPKDFKNARFGVEVKGLRTPSNKLRDLAARVKLNRDNGLITMPVLLFLIDDKLKTGKVDFLVYPGVIKPLMVRQHFKFKELNPVNLDLLIEILIDKSSIL